MSLCWLVSDCRAYISSKSELRQIMYCTENAWTEKISFYGQIEEEIEVHNKCLETSEFKSLTEEPTTNMFPSNEPLYANYALFFPLMCVFTSIAMFIFVMLFSVWEVAGYQIYSTLLNTAEGFYTHHCEIFLSVLINYDFFPISWLILRKLYRRRRMYICNFSWVYRLPCLPWKHNYVLLVWTWELFFLLVIQS